ncbi:type 1 glutamine amidotransferase [Lysobacter auxotrophicus]|uniref:Gamma-glutamyl-gamma-aminobutyrate hydrolase family protein n=1 Tax=Lysobacter auxotrophicus TaxID=2992573 RepID=A0ABN6UKU4_9GAMM|nr:gamma-glutamyl-gamma-aminobutyrate hydrolase family protein [Lysobacter auxotrophicus]BDU16959.1 gamma-glutamyl-gamma-aminobutyrate hydrolase family protein [Lysobacter auxotrophicus]
MSRLLVFQHVAAEPLGTLDRLIRRRGHRIRFANFERQPELEPNVDRYRGLVVLGGPMNVEDQARRPHLKTELRAIEAMLEQGKPVLGICLGAQLLAHVLGAPVRRHEAPEIGWYPLNTTQAGREDPVLSPLGDTAPVFQWHRYRFEVPREAAHLASTAGCDQQAFRYGENAYGFQFHLEMDEALIERWLANPAYREELAELRGLDPARADVETIRRHTREHIAGMQSRADEVFNRFLDLVGRPQRRITLPSREWV